MRQAEPTTIHDLSRWSDAQIAANFGTEAFATDLGEIRADVRQRLEDVVAATPIQHSAKVGPVLFTFCYEIWLWPPCSSSQIVPAHRALRPADAFRSYIATSPDDTKPT